MTLDESDTDVFRSRSDQGSVGWPAMEMVVKDDRTIEVARVCVRTIECVHPIPDPLLCQKSDASAPSVRLRPSLPLDFNTSLKEREEAADHRMATKKTGKDALLWWCQEITKGYESEKHLCHHSIS
jgi:hypothetical protein